MFEYKQIVSVFSRPETEKCYAKFIKCTRVTASRISALENGGCRNATEKPMLIIRGTLKCCHDSPLQAASAFLCETVVAHSNSHQPLRGEPVSGKVSQKRFI